MDGDGILVSHDEFAALFQRSAQVLWCLAAAVLGRPKDADDVLQESALIALKKLDDLRDQDGFEAWMGQIVRYTALNARRKADRRPPVVGDAGSDDCVLDRVAAPEDAPAPVVTAGGDLLPSQVAFDDQVLDALRDLAETARACLLMKTVMELDYKHIARVLGIAEGTAMSHVHRARSRMRAALSAEGLDAGRVAS
ncbi:MAG: hypothetical protein CMJ83_15070 [Planctomycetes bacterium]|nr:hypothetical protein [Planctomycetota bacterium]